MFSHEQGSGAKNASATVEEIILDHIVRCKGESVKVIISGNASVGKNWLTTIALPQYMVDQGLADVVLIVFMENNHGNWLADMLFGQFQTLRKRTNVLGIDDLLSGFEGINRKSGNVYSFALNPLASVDFSKIFCALGYQVKPPRDFGFAKRNIHFAGACSSGAKLRMPHTLRQLLEDALPDDPGMVRVCSDSPLRGKQRARVYSER